MNQDLAAISPHLKLKVSRRARRMALRLDPHNRAVNLVVPPRASLRKAHEFARQHEHWIREKIDSLPLPVPFTNGTIIPVLGKERTIRIIHDPGHKRTSIHLADDEIVIHTNKDDPSGRVTTFLKNLAREKITALTHEKAELLGKKAISIQMRDTRSRWGSCAPDGRMCFSWRLVLAPFAALDYVVAHEVAHMEHMNHGKAFWNLCARLAADFKTGRRWMREHGHTLMTYGQTMEAPLQAARAGAR